MELGKVFGHSFNITPPCLWSQVMMATAARSLRALQPCTFSAQHGTKAPGLPSREQSQACSSC